MFDGIPATDLANLQSIGDFVSAYIGIAHCKKDGDYAYSGSATWMDPFRQGIGEAYRMDGHRRILSYGHAEIMRRRKALGSSSGALFIHEKMSSEGTDYFFFPAMRYSVTVDEPKPIHTKSAALALLAENCNTALLASQRIDHAP